MESLRPDPTFHPSPRLAMEAEPERIAYTALLSPDRSRPDAHGRGRRRSATRDSYGTVLHRRRHAEPRRRVAPLRLERLQLGAVAAVGPRLPAAALPGRAGHALARASTSFDTQPDPRKPTLAKTIEPDEVLRKTGYSRPHTVHCGPEGIYISTLGGGGTDGTAGPPGIFLMDCESFEVLGRWEIDRGPQKLHYDFWWNLPRDYMVSSEWALPPQFENGIVAEDLLANKYGHRLHFWDLRARRNVQTIDLGANHQMALEVRPAHDPDAATTASSAWWSTPPTWKPRSGPGGARTARFHARKTAVVPPEPADAAQLPALLKGFGAVPPLISDIDLSMDDRFLYVACWGTGELRQYDVSDPMQPKLAGSVRVGGIAAHAPHPSGRPFGGGPQMTEISRDGQRVYFTNSLYSSWDTQFYPDGVPGRAGDVQGAARTAGSTLDQRFCVDFGDGLRRAPGPAAGRRLLHRFLLLSLGLSSSAALWLTVVALGVYHGLNPAMGWPLAVANGLRNARGRRRVRDLAAAGRGAPGRDGGGAGAVRLAGWATSRGAARSARRPARRCCCSASTGWCSGAIRARWRACARRSWPGGPS